LGRACAGAGPTQASGGNRRCFRRVRDLADDLDDVPVRVPDPALAVGAVPPREDFSDPLELAVGPELARESIDRIAAAVRTFYGKGGAA